MNKNTMIALTIFALLGCALLGIVGMAIFCFLGANVIGGLGWATAAVIALLFLIPRF